MSKSANMLRTRRRDNNVKPNRRLDRKSSRGMLYENEELRLKTININAEIERGQSDIKKLKRENEMLKKEIWCLRDEYEKLDKLLKEKEIEFSSSSTTGSSDSDSCSTCSEESEEVETSQNIENVHKTNLKNLRNQFDHLSVVPEENSTENSDRNSLRISLPNEVWTNDKDILKADQSYPSYENISKSSTLPVQDKMPTHFFSPIKISKSFEDSLADCSQPNSSQKFMENTYYWNRPQSFKTFKPFSNLNHHSSCPNGMASNQNTNSGYPQTSVQNYEFYPHNPVGFQPALEELKELPPMSKASTDLIVKMDNKNFVPTSSQSTFSNGGNLEELLNDIETISQDILQISSSAQGLNQNLSEHCPNFSSNSHLNETAAPIGFKPAPGPLVDYRNLSYIPNSKRRSFELSTESTDNSLGSKPFKSELNVVLLPTPMPLIGFDKYRNLQRSCESMQRSLENLSASHQSLCVIPESIDPSQGMVTEDVGQNLLMAPSSFCNVERVPTPLPHVCLTPLNTPAVLPLNDLRAMPSNISPIILASSQDSNPFYFGNLPDPGPNPFLNPPVDQQEVRTTKEKEKPQKTSKPDTKSKSSLIDLTSSDIISSENDEHIQQKPSETKKEKTDATSGKKKEVNKSEGKSESKTKEEGKVPKLSIRRKVSIHFKGKREKAKEKDKIKNLAELGEGVRKDSVKIGVKNEAGKLVDDKKDKKNDLNKLKLSLGDHTKSKTTSDDTSKLKTANSVEGVKPKTPVIERKHGIFEKRHVKTPSMDSKKSNVDVHVPEPKTPSSESKSSLDKKHRIDSQTSTDSKTDKEKPSHSERDKKTRKSSSLSPDRRHGHSRDEKRHRKHGKKADRLRQRRSTISNDRFHRERSFSVCTDRSNNVDNKYGYGFNSGYYYDDYMFSDRERTNSMSSLETVQRRKISNTSNFPVNGKIPWCGCWGNGCL